MYQFKKTSSIASRVNTIIKNDVESRGETWLVSLGYMECNDYAQYVVNTVSQASGFEHIRFETVARYVRQHKAMIKAKLSQNNTQGVK